MDIMTKDKIIEYLKENQFFGQDDVLEVTDILSETQDAEGMINQLYRVMNSDSGRSVIVKQVMPYMLLLKKRTGQEFALNMNRMKKEVRMFKFLHGFQPGSVPEIYKLDEDAGLIIMEDLRTYRVMRYTLSEGKTIADFGRRMGYFLGKMYFFTSAHYLGVEKKVSMAETFENQSSKRLMADLLSGKNCVLFDPLRLFEKEAKPVHDRLCNDQALKDIVYTLDDRFVTSRECLCHNDCHVGNIMVDNDRIRLIDMEFSGYADPLMDLGRLTSSFLTNYLSWTGRLDVREPFRTEMQAYNLETIGQLFESYRGTVTELVEEYGSKAPDSPDAETILKPIIHNSMRLAVLAMACRTSTDDFRTFDIRCIDDFRQLGKIQKIALLTAEYVLKHTEDLKDGYDLATVLATVKTALS